jgi:hypothetical protein
MLRNALLLFAFLVAGTGIVLCLFAGQPQAFPVALWGSVLLVLIVLERWRYVLVSKGDPAQFEPTDEQFIDPETGRLTRVFYNAASGERRYEVIDSE